MIGNCFTKRDFIFAIVIPESEDYHIQVGFKDWAGMIKLEKSSFFTTPGCPIKENAFSSLLDAEKALTSLEKWLKV